MQSTHAQERTRTVTTHLASSLVLACSQTRYEECPYVLQWALDGTFSPEDTPPIKRPTPLTKQCADNPQRQSASLDESDPNSGIRMSSTSALDGHVRATSEHTQTSHRPATITQNASDSSFPDSLKTSARSSVSSFARRVMRAGPDLRLINADKTDLAEKFSPGGGRRITITSPRKVMTYEDPSKASEVPPANPPAVAAPEPKPAANRSHWFKALRKHGSESERPVESTTVSPMLTPNASMQQLHFHSKSEGFAARSNVSTDDSLSEYASSIGGISKASAERQEKCPSSRSSPQKTSRPIFAHLRSQSSHLLKSSKPRSPLPVHTQPKSAAQTPVSTSNGSHNQPSTLSQNKDSKRSIKRRLWRGPLAPGDIRSSIANVISPVKMIAEKPDAEPIKFIEPDAPALPKLSTPQRHLRFGSTHQSNGGEERVVHPLPLTPDDLHEAARSTPNTRDDRREGGSYFSLGGNSTPSPHSKHYSPDFIGTSLGGISPPESPRSPTTFRPWGANDFLQAAEGPSRQDAIRRGSMLPGFVPPGQKRVNTPPDFGIDRVTAGKNAGFFFAGPSPENGKSAGRAPGARATPTHHTTPSSGVWDSDAVLMSQGIAAEDEWNAPRRLTPVKLPVPGHDWFRVQLSHIMAEEPPKTSSDVDRPNPGFAWDVPEHLPGSPLCPLHPKHKGGGKGICVYHGRKKM